MGRNKTKQSKQDGLAKYWKKPNQMLVTMPPSPLLLLLTLYHNFLKIQHSYRNLLSSIYCPSKVYLRSLGFNLNIYSTTFQPHNPEKVTQILQTSTISSVKWGPILPPNSQGSENLSEILDGRDLNVGNSYDGYQLDVSSYCFYYCCHYLTCFFPKRPEYVSSY